MIKQYFYRVALGIGVLCQLVSTQAVILLLHVKTSEAQGLRYQEHDPNQRVHRRDTETSRPNRHLPSLNPDAFNVPDQRGQAPPFKHYPESGCQSDMQLRSGSCNDAEERAKSARVTCQADQASTKLGAIPINACSAQNVTFGGSLRSNCSCLLVVPSLTHGSCRKTFETYQRMVQFNDQLRLRAFEEAANALEFFSRSTSELKINYSVSNGRIAEFSLGDIEETNPLYERTLTKLRKLRKEIPAFCSLGTVAESTFRQTAEAWASSFSVTFGPEIAARSRDIAELKKSCIPVIMQGRNELGIVRNNFTRQEADKVCGCIGEAGAGQAFIKYATQAEALSPVEAIFVQQITGGCILNLNLEGFAKGMPR